MFDSIEDEKVKKFFLDKYGPDARKAIVDQNAQDSSGPSLLAGLAGLATTLQGGSGYEGAEKFKSARQNKLDKKLSDFDAERKLAMDERSMGIEDRKLAREELDYKKAQERAMREDDPNSEESKLAQQMAIDMGVNPDLATKLTATRLMSQLPFLQKKLDLEQRRLDRREVMADRALQRELLQQQRDEKKEEKIQGLQTPYGLANSVDDAKQLKQAHESKLNFDNKLNEMINLRKKYGGEALNREAVARGKQLSKDLLLEYKNMAKLGVLSQSDEDIINAIIPDDPLGFSGSQLLGQDPILSNLEKFKLDKDLDFQNKIETRTRSGLANYGQKTDVVLMRSPDGKIKKVPRSQIAAAQAAGGTLVDNVASK